MTEVVVKLFYKNKDHDPIYSTIFLPYLKYGAKNNKTVCYHRYIFRTSTSSKMPFRKKKNFLIEKKMTSTAKYFSQFKNYMILCPEFWLKQCILKNITILYILHGKICHFRLFFFEKSILSKKTFQNLEHPICACMKKHSRPR